MQKQNKTLYIYLFSYKDEPKTMLYLELNNNKYEYESYILNTYASKQRVKL